MVREGRSSTTTATKQEAYIAVGSGIVYVRGLVWRRPRRFTTLSFHSWRLRLASNVYLLLVVVTIRCGVRRYRRRASNRQS